MRKTYHPTMKTKPDLLFFCAVLMFCFFHLLPIEPVYSAVPTVTSVNPDTGTTDSVTRVTIKGADFEPGAKVSLLNGGPLLIGSYDTPGSANDVYVSGDYAYVADWDSGLQIIDISNPASPVPVGSYDTPGSALDVYVLGNYAYVADGWNSGLLIIDVSDPASPVFVGSYETTGYVTSERRGPWGSGLVSCNFTTRLIKSLHGKTVKNRI